MILNVQCFQPQNRRLEFFCIISVYFIVTANSRKYTTEHQTNKVIFIKHSNCAN